MALNKRSTLTGAGMVVVGLLCGGAKSAHAGYWKVTLYTQGTASSTTWDETVGRMVTQSWPINAMDDTQGGDTFYFHSVGPYAEGRMGQESSVSGSLTHRIKLEWQRTFPAGVPDPPDAYISMKLWGDATAWSYNFVGEPSLQAPVNPSRLTSTAVQFSTRQGRSYAVS